MLAQPAVPSKTSSESTRQPVTAPGHGPSKSGPSVRSAGRRWLHLHEGRDLPELEVLLGRAGGEQMHGAGDDAGPAGLVGRTEPRPVVAVEVLVEQNEVPP